jgi:hypothetical protein
MATQPPSRELNPEQVVDSESLTSFAIFLARKIGQAAISRASTASGAWLTNNNSFFGALKRSSGE